MHLDYTNILKTIEDKLGSVLYSKDWLTGVSFNLHKHPTITIFVHTKHSCYNFSSAKELSHWIFRQELLRKKFK